MTRRKEDEDMELVSVRLFKSDKARLQSYYPKAGYNRVIRTLVRKHIRALDEKFSRKIATEELFNEQPDTIPADSSESD